MIKFLLQRPIAVFMAFTACFIVGLVTFFTLPVSLLPDIAIPQITVRITSDNASARELENTAVTPVRRQLLQVAGLKEITSETHDGSAIIRLGFDFGVNTDLAFIEVNEKIDAAMNNLPRELARPKVIKASATDIPVLYLNMTLKNDVPYGETNERSFLDMCELAENVVKRRIEQLPEVAMADITGVPGSVLQIVPDNDKMEVAGVTIEDLENALAANNVEPGSMLVRDGYYEYNIRVASLLRTPEDVEQIYLRKGNRLMQLKEFCRVNIVTKKETGRSLADGKRAVTLAVIKQSDENMDAMKEKLYETTDYFTTAYPEVQFSISRNQTELLDYTVSNLQQNLILGILFIFIVAVLFLGDVRSPLIIGISMFVSIVITFLFFYFFHVSINVISLSGLILAVGMMIDSAIIVTENISQFRERGHSLEEACSLGTNEMITPMLSSALTTVAMFVPLIFMSGIAGAVFTDQAFAIAAGLGVSYITCIMMLPVLYLLFYRSTRQQGWFAHRFHRLMKNEWLDTAYDRGIDWVFSHKTICLLATLATLPLCVLLFGVLDRERMPAIDQNELIAHIEWNENIHTAENNNRVEDLLQLADPLVTEHAAYVGERDYLLNADGQSGSTEAELYFKTPRAEDIQPLQQLLEKEARVRFPSATVTFLPPETIFEKLFETGEPDVVARVQVVNKSRAPEAEQLRALERELAETTGLPFTGLTFCDQINLVVNREKLLLYQVSYEELTRVLRTAFKENRISTLRSYQQYLPIQIADETRSVNRILRETLIRTLPDNQGQVARIPLAELVTPVPVEDLKSITAGKNGEYMPFAFSEVKEPKALIGQIEQKMTGSTVWDVDFSGAFFSNEQMLKELMVILFVSLLLMYFILCAQFESFLQPFIVLIEIPIDTAFALLALWIFGHTLNLMSAIGIIVTCGIVVNDSILKLDGINELRKTGMPLFEAIHTAGKRRLRPIIMTSLTTIFAMVPLLFSSDMGSELQQPLAVAMIGSMLVGTVVSLFVVPLIYWFIYRKHDKNEIH